MEMNALNSRWGEQLLSAVRAPPGAALHGVRWRRWVACVCLPSLRCAVAGGWRHTPLTRDTEVEVLGGVDFPGRKCRRVASRRVLLAWSWRCSLCRVMCVVLGMPGLALGIGKDQGPQTLGLMCGCGGSARRIRRSLLLRTPPPGSAAPDAAQSRAVTCVSNSPRFASPCHPW